MTTATPNTVKNATQSLEGKITELRVAQSELVSGDTNGKVFLQMSKGAVGLLVDRSVAHAQVSTDLRQTLLLEDQDIMNPVSSSSPSSS